MCRLLPLACLLALLSGCGGSPKSTDSATPTVPASLQPKLSQFPAPKGKTLQQVANMAAGKLTLGLGTSVYTPGPNRLAFGLLDDANAFVFGPSAVYVAADPSAPAQGPFLAPLESLQTAAPFRSQTTAADSSDPKQIYFAHVPARKAGPLAILVLTRNGGKTYGAATTIRVAASSPIPNLGQRPPAINTPTGASAGGDFNKIDTRVPHDDMHTVSFKDVLGRKPVALLFATPALCQSRVCGPVVDQAAELESQFRDRMTFIHMEIYKDNTVSKGYRPQLAAFSLRSEPWLFTVNRSGRIAARLEGSFGLREFRQAVLAALK